MMTELLALLFLLFSIRLKKRDVINEIASSHMARRTFIGNIYKLVIDMKKDLVKILEGGK